MDPTSLPQFRDVPWRWIAYASSALLMAAIVFAFNREIEIKQDVPCEIVSSSEVKIRGISGLVSSIYVQPRTQVAQGAPLFRLQRDLSLASDGRQRVDFDARMHDEQLAAADTQWVQRKAQLRAQLDGARATDASRRAELSALDEQIAQTDALAAGSERKLRRLEAAAGFVTANRVEDASAEVHQAKASVAQSIARRAQLVGEIGALRNTRADLDAQSKELDARHARDVQDIQLRFEQSRQDTTISAPKAGTVTFSSLVPGRMLAPEDVALVIATGDDRRLRAALLIPSRRRGFVRIGQTVRLKFDAFPYAKFGTYEARIDALSDTTVDAPATPDGNQKNAGKPAGDSYMAWTTLRGRTFDYEGQHFDILPGMRATASIVVERRTIAEWVLAPLFRVWRG
ncbi:HlyD family secretion protein [Paraburkholderia solisilvae]|uniref:Colicin V secretion protein CvaA n=1 Tax=Paraburkholderia solisilvae TaxID=624376 RepID=A0A6J5DAG4_9BURK|nr:HlyD family efflux transporter periplasmic adaptor subunit [Paraburkholderia solisilvae]CAB3750407.1 Colicin V secretion protein CvaA [Paraburkholderia solisilvae]